MSSHWLLNALQPSPRAAGRRRFARRLLLEPLEDRCLLAFAAAESYPVGAYPEAVLTADMNSDGRLDLVAANRLSSDVSVLLGNADGTFAAARHFATGVNPRSVAVGDFNNDGNLDVATANYGGTDVSVLLGDGNGALGAPQSVPLPTPPPTVVDPPLAVAVGDFNADGKLDLVATSQDSYTYSWYGGGYYGGGYYGGYYGGGWGGSYTVYRGYVHVILGHGDGSFATPTTTQISSGFPMAVAVADFDNDGKPDVATANQDWSTVSVLLGNGDGTLRYNWYSSDFAASWSPRALTVGDFTGDGILDIATAGQTVDILPGLGNGAFQPVVRQYVDPVTLAAADFNGDGHLDVVTAEPTAGTVSVLLGTGAGTLTLPIDLAAGSLPSAVAVGDFNGDGRPDVAAANAGSGDVSVLLNDGAWPALDAPYLRIDDVTVTEGNAGTVDAAFTVTLSALSNQDVTVRYATGDYAWNPATPGSDYVATTGQVTIPAGQISATFDVSVMGDRIGEYSERFAVRLTEPVNAFIADGQGVATIVDDEPRITIDWFASAMEGNTGTTPIDFKVRLSAPSDEEVRVNFSTAEGDIEWWYYGYYYYYGAATAGVDFEPQDDVLVFDPGELEQTISILARGDRIAETTEFFLVNLSNPIGAAIDTGQGVGHILDDEPWLNIVGTTVVEGDSGTTEATFTVTLSGPSDAPVSVDYATSDEYWYGANATSGVDYLAAIGSVIFYPDQPLTQTITVLVNGDTTAEFVEYFTVQLANASGAHLSDWPVASAAIIDDDPHLSISDVSLQEGNSGVTYFTFTVSLSVASAGEVTVRYATADSWAQAGTDYQSQSGTLVFAAGETSKTIRIAVYGDGVKEGDETFYVVLSEFTGSTLIDDAWGIGTILNDDADSPNGGKGYGKGGKKK
jgi:hypothetical protein